MPFEPKARRDRFSSFLILGITAPVVLLVIILGLLVTVYCFRRKRKFSSLNFCSVAYNRSTPDTPDLPPTVCMLSNNACNDNSYSC